jgi:thiol-disulfide isomerase/thioredoxin
MNDENYDGGKRRKTYKRRSQKQSKIIVGKIYANWCGHCQALKPEWKKMRKIVKGKPSGKRIQFVEISEEQMGDKLSKLNKAHGVQINSSGYPTLFKLVNGKVDYYEGSREAHPLAEWAMKGGEPQNTIPNLFADVQGGKRTIHTRKIAKTRKRRGFIERLFGYGAS